MAKIQKHLHEGVKHDADKLRYDLVPVEAMKMVVRVLTHGARKYDDDNWKQVSGLQDRYYAAAMRHLEVFREGVNIDYDSGLPHLAHAACCILFKLQDTHEQIKESGFESSYPEEYYEDGAFNREESSEVYTAPNDTVGESSETLCAGCGGVRGEQLDECNDGGFGTGEGQLIEAFLSAITGDDRRGPHGSSRV